MRYGNHHADGGALREGPLTGDTFDRVLYPELIHPQTHADRLAVVGRLLGLQPAPVQRCRVLELGCGTGVNVIAMAQELPDSHFIGVDNSPQHAARGRDIIDRLGLRNATVFQADIRELEVPPEPYDFIVAHGVYSWVEPDVRRALLRAIRQQLAPHGIALVSYNTYPGWYMLRSIREMMCFHARDESDPLRRVDKGMEFVGFLLDHLDPQVNLYAANLAEYRRATRERRGLLDNERAASILYDELAAVNEPVFFFEFMQQANDCGLQYVAEADLKGSTPAGLAPSAVRDVRRFASDLISLEQYLDFLMNRTFRQTLLCHREIVLTRTLTSGRDVLQQLYCSTGTAASPADSAQVLSGDGTLRITSADGIELVTKHALSKAAILALAAAAPGSLAWDQLVAKAGSLTGKPASDQDLDILSATLLHGFTLSRSLVRLSTLPDRFTTVISGWPKASPLVRLLAAEGQPRVPSKRHERVFLETGSLEMVEHLDGVHSLDQLREIFERRAGKDTFEAVVEFLAKSALLEA